MLKVDFKFESVLDMDVFAYAELYEKEIVRSREFCISFLIFHTAQLVKRDTSQWIIKYIIKCKTLNNDI